MERADGSKRLLKRALLQFSVLYLRPEGRRLKWVLRGCSVSIAVVLARRAIALSLSSEMLGVPERIVFEAMCVILLSLFWLETASMV